MMTQTTATNGISRVEFMPSDLAQQLGVHEQQIRIAAKKLGINTPYTQPERDAIAAELRTPEPVGIVTTGERFEDAIAPLEPSPAPGDADLYNTARAALKARLVERLKADFTNIETEALKEILG